MRIRPYVAQMLSVISGLTPLVLVVVLYWQQCPALAEAVAAAAGIRAECEAGTSCGADHTWRRWLLWVKVAALSSAHLVAAVSLCLLKHPEGVAVVAEMGRRAVVRLLGRCPYSDR